MHKSGIIICIIFSFVLNQTYGVNSYPDQNKNILVLFSLAPTTPAYRYILDGIQEKLTRELGTSYSLHMEYLETERYPKGKFPREIFDLYNKKYEGVKLDLMICVGVDIIGTVRNNADSLLQNLPTITIDFDLSGYGHPFDLTLNPQTAVIGLKLDAWKTISEALDIFPNTSSIYFICGISRVDSVYMQVSKEEAKKISSRINVSFINQKSMDEVLDLVHNLPPNSLIVVSGFNTDSNHIPYYNPEAVRLISKSANAPLFTYSDMGFGEGSFGGKIMSFAKIGKLTGETAVRVLKGQDPNSIKITEDDYYDYLFDWREMVKWNQTELERKKTGGKVLYKDVTFIGKYKWLMSIGLAFLILQSLLIVTLFRLNRRQKKMTRQIIETDRRYMDIMREDRILRMGMLTVSLSHELNQPLTAILSTAQAGKRFLDSGDAKHSKLKEILDNIVEADNRAASVLKSIRGLMKLEKREKERVNLNNLITEVSDLYSSKAIELNSRLNLKLTDSAVFIVADAIQIQQVLLNLISNASQSVGRSGNITNIITILETIDNEFVIVSVRDYGKGIDQTIMDKLFEPFVTSRTEGTGVGLAISRFIIEDHQGRIWAENKPEGGAEFSFKLKMV